MNYEWYGRKIPWPDSQYYSSICSVGLKRKHATPVRTVDIQTELWILRMRSTSANNATIKFCSQTVLSAYTVKNKFRLPCLRYIGTIYFCIVNADDINYLHKFIFNNSSFPPISNTYVIPGLVQHLNNATPFLCHIN
jgi:hypothetical protein